MFVIQPKYLFSYCSQCLHVLPVWVIAINHVILREMTALSPAEKLVKRQDFLASTPVLQPLL